MRAASILVLVAILGCGSGGAAGSGGSTSDAGIGGKGGAGGSDAGPPVTCAATGTWSDVGQTDVGRYAPGVAVLGSGAVLFAGGWDTAKKAQKTGFLVDPASNAITPTGALSQARNFPAVAPVPGGFLFAGGFNDGLGSLSRADVYD